MHVHMISVGKVCFLLLCVLFCMASKIFRSYYVMGLLLSVCTQYYLCSSWSWPIVDYWHGIKAGINFVYCSSTRFQTTDANMQKWVLLFFIFLDQDSELFLSPDICPLVISHFDLLENHCAKLDQLWCDTPWVVLCQNVSGDIALHPRWCHNFWLVEKLKKKNWMEWNQILLNTPWIVSFQHCVSGFHHLSKMDTTADYAIFGFPAWSFLLKSDLTNILK